MTENKKLLQTFMDATEDLLGHFVMEAKAADPAAHARGRAWLDTPGSRLEIRIDLGGLNPSPTHSVRCVVVDAGYEAIWELFNVSTPSGNT